MKKSFSKIRHIKETNILLENRFLNEEQDSVSQIMNLSKEIGSDISREEAEMADTCTIDEIQPDAGTKPEAIKVFNQIKSVIKTMVQNNDKGGLKNAFKELKGKLRDVESNKEGVKEQKGTTALAATFTLLGVSAPLWVWVAIGAIVLVVLITGIVRLTSWIPRKKGKGCSRKITYRVR